jgi:beta-glucosidase
VKNTGARDGEEVVQVYFRHVKSAVPQAQQALCGFQRVNLAAGKSATVELEIPASAFRFWDVSKKTYVVESGDYELLIGGASDSIRIKLPVQVR